MANDSGVAAEGYAEALRRIDACKEARSYSLDLMGLSLTTLPAEISQLGWLGILSLDRNELTTFPLEIDELTSLKMLGLNRNKLTTLPPNIARLKSLSSLTLGNNQLCKLPSEIGKLTALKSLHLYNNQLTTLPPEIGQLTSLVDLLVFSNRLTMIPAQIGQLAGLIDFSLAHNQLRTLPSQTWQLTTLKTLSLIGNQLTTVPKEIGQLTALEELWLSSNRLQKLPAEIGQLAGLTQLALADNQLMTLPSQIWQLTALKYLSLSGNQLATLPEEIGQLSALEDLYLDRNQLTTLPEQMGQLLGLERLFLHDNPSLNIPDSILGETFYNVVYNDKKAARPHDILNFYFARQLGAIDGTLRRLNEIKVMLVGRGGAGKTSLRRYFMGKPHNKEEQETPGIALESFALRCSQGEMKVRLWDFAGQEITHALHQFFLTEGCVYILVLDPRSNTEMQDAEYWLGLLQRYAPGTPVLVALNRQDARQGGYDVDRQLLQERFPWIHSYSRTNCQERDGCDELKQRLCDAIGALKETEPPHLQVPDTWLKIMESCALEARGKAPPIVNKLLHWIGLAGHPTPSVKGRERLTLDQFRKICFDKGETNQKRQDSLARLLHKLGVVLHFVDEPRLRDTTVLNPHWVTDGVYRLLRFKDRPESDGTLTLAEALLALPGEGEPEARFLLRLMERFQMCFPLDEEPDKLAGKWLIPGALGEFQPAAVTTDWQNPGRVRLRYVYEPLPEGVLPRFIVMTNLLSEGKTRWRNGVVLEDGPASALVRRGEKRNHVEVTAFGPDAERLRLLEIIQGNLERIHSDLPDPKPIAEIELAGLPGTFRRIADLEAAERQHVNVAVNTGSLQARVDPTPQLNLTSEPAARGESRVPLKAFLSYSHKDKGAKSIFQDNLTVMTKKNIITPWHDGLIEPGMRWRQEVEENLGKMDVFLGLLTTAFLASDFIEKVEIKAARQKIGREEKDFVFVLILVDDISLAELDLSEYQILKPGGKAVCEHTSRKEGFNIAQKELEALILARQDLKRQQKSETPNLLQTELPRNEKQGVTIINVQGHYFREGMTMHDDHSIKIGGNVVNSQVGGTLNNCTNMVQQQSPGTRKNLLEGLTADVRRLIESLPEQRQKEAPKLAKKLETLVEQASSSEPDREWYSLSAKGLLEASKWVKDFSGNIGGSLLNLGKLFWPDFQLSEFGG